MTRWETAMRSAARRRMMIGAAAGLALAAGGVAHAHHGWSGYDATQLVSLSGTVQSATFESPHGLMMLESGGKMWRVVLAPPSRMERRGLPTGSIEAGQSATVEGYPNRTDPEEFRAERIRVEGGETVELR